MRIKNIVIVGGGTAGWVTAHQFLNKTSGRVKVTVVASKEIPIIGVGESTTGRFKDLIELPRKWTNINEHSFLKETGSTFKIGIKHSDWHTKGQSFYSPIGDTYSNDQLYPSKDYDNFRIYHVANKIDYNKTFQSLLMVNNKVHFGPHGYQCNKRFPVAYHLDTYKVGQYFKETAIALKSRCRYVEDTVVGIKQDRKGFVKGVITKKGKIIKGDFFIDCSGFRRVLIKHFCTKFISYADSLLVNRALAFHVDYKENETIRNYTHAWAQKYGWLWQIPTQKRMGCGYVYCDHYLNPQQAQKEIEKTLGHSIEPQNDIKFESGRLEKFWAKNVMTIGLSSGFIEPLEATSIHATILQANHFIENYYKEHMPFECNLLQDQYNKEMSAMHEQIKDFIVFHYITPRKDTPFWVESSSPKRWSKRLQELMEIWKYRMPRSVDYVLDKTNNFYFIGSTLWFQIALGMKSFNSEIATQELKDYGLYEVTEKYYDVITKGGQEVLPYLYHTNDYYKTL